MLKVGLGLAGYVDISVQGARGIREYQFNNAFTDTGLARMSGAWDGIGFTPAYLLLGSGRFEGADHAATGLVQQIHRVMLNYKSSTTEVGSETLTVTHKYTSESTPKGSAWVLREFGSVWSPSPSTFTTYSQLRDSQGNPTEIQLDETDVVTFTYYFQHIYPIRYEGTMQWESAGVVEEVPYTFSLGVGESPDLTNWTDVYYNASRLLSLGAVSVCTGEFGTGSEGTSLVGAPLRFSEQQSNGTWRSFYKDRGSPNRAMGFTFSRPLTKANTQTLEINVEWELTNATPVPVPDV